MQCRGTLTLKCKDALQNFHLVCTSHLTLLLILLSSFGSLTCFPRNPSQNVTPRFAFWDKWDLCHNSAISSNLLSSVILLCYFFVESNYLFSKHLHATSSFLIGIQFLFIDYIPTILTNFCVSNWLTVIFSVWLQSTCTQSSLCILSHTIVITCCMRNIFVGIPSHTAMLSCNRILYEKAERSSFFCSIYAQYSLSQRYCSKCTIVGYDSGARIIWRIVTFTQVHSQ